MGSIRGTRVSTTATAAELDPVSHSGSATALGELGEMALRVLEIIFFFYFASHIPITLFIDLQALLPGHVFPQPVSKTEPKLQCNLLQVTINCFVVRRQTSFSFCPPAEGPSEMVRRGVQRPHGAGSSTVVQVLYFLRGFAPAAFLPGRSLCFPEGSVHTQHVTSVVFAVRTRIT